jgi:hypothetical protein
MKRNFLALVLATAAATASLAGPAWAKTQVFTETSEDQFAQGKSDGVVWTSTGHLRLGRALESLMAQTEGVDYVARMAEGPDGAVYAATGGSGRVYRLKDGKAALYATIPDKFLFSILVDKNGDLYVGSGGAKGRLWHVSVQAKGDPKTEVLFEADDVKYIWDLAWMKDGRLAAATGDKGKVYAVTTAGKGEVLIKSESNHVLCLTVGPDGTLYAGTDGEAVVYRWADKKTFILYDADEAEITALALDSKGNLYVAASSAGAGRSAGTEMSDASPTSPTRERRGMTSGEESSAKEDAATNGAGKNGAAEVGASKNGAGKDDSAKDGAGKPSDSASPAKPAAAASRLFEFATAVSRAASGAGSKSGSGGKGSAVYCIAPDGVVTRVFEARDSMILALAISDDKVLVGTGKNGRIYEIGRDPEEEEATIASIDPKQVMSLLVTADGRVIVGSAGPGRLYSLSKGYAKDGTYTSHVYDAGSSARWGTLEWRGQTPAGAEVLFATRTGNIRDPEKGMWTDWSKPIAKSGARIESPAGRFIQFRVTMHGRGDAATPVVDEYRAMGLRVNEPPKVLSIAEAPSPDQVSRTQAMDRLRQSLKAKPKAGGSSSLAASSPTAPPPEGPQTVRFFQWQASDPDSDALRYDLYFRAEGAPDWVLLERDLTRSDYAWDTATVADGWYQVKVVASDRADNPAETAREDSKISDPVLVDNTAPLIENLDMQVRAGGEIEVRFTARDALGRLTAAGYAVDSAMEWNALAPADGIFDGRQKEFRFILKNLPAGSHWLAVRVSDESQNVGHAAKTFTVGK